MSQSNTLVITTVYQSIRRTSLKTTYLRDGRFLLKDCLLLLLLLLDQRKASKEPVISQIRKWRGNKRGKTRATKWRLIAKTGPGDDLNFLGQSQSFVRENQFNPR